MTTSQDLPVELQCIARATGRGNYKLSPTFHAASVATATGTGDKTLVAGVAAQRFFCTRLVFTPALTGTVQFWSGPSASGTALTGVMNVLAGVEYVFENLLFTLTDAHALVLQAVTDVQHNGRITGWYF